MQQELQNQLVRRVLAHLEQRTTDTADAPSRLPVDVYTDPARYARELERLFRGAPIAVAHVSQLAQPGDFVTHDASGVPLIVSRTDTGELAAFLNVCRHRGTRVEPAPCGNRTAFVCPYHAWSYARDGAPLAIPHQRGFAGVEPRGLVRIPVGEVAGLVFVRASPGTEPLDAASWLGPLADDLAGFGTRTGAVYAPRRELRPLNWKLAIDIFLEAYHLRSAHRSTIYPMFFDNTGLVDRVGPHLRNVFPKRTIRELAGEPDATWQLRRHANILFHLFPNTLVLVEPDHAAVLHLWPQGPAHTLLASYTLVPEPPATDKARAYWDANNAILYNATDEDFTLGESIQAGLASGANRDVVFGAFEHALEHFHAQIAARLG